MRSQQPVNTRPGTTIMQQVAMRIRRIRALFLLRGYSAPEVQA